MTRHYWPALMLLFLMACTTPQVVYVVATSTPVPVAMSLPVATHPPDYSGGFHVSPDQGFTDAPTPDPGAPTPSFLITPVAVAFAPDVVPIDSPGDYFTPEVLQWSDHIRRWSIEYGLQERLIAILIQVGSCGDPNYRNRVQKRYGLFAGFPRWYDIGDNLFDPEEAAAASLPVLADHLRSFDHVRAYYAYYDGASQLISGQLWELSSYSDNARYLWGKSRTGAQICPE